MDRRASDNLKKAAASPKRPLAARRGKPLPVDTPHE